MRNSLLNAWAPYLWYIFASKQKPARWNNIPWATVLWSNSSPIKKSKT